MDQLDTLFTFLSVTFSTYAASIPDWAITVLAVVGSCHLVLPALQALIQKVVELTPSKSDDLVYEKVTQSKAYLVFAKVVRFVSGLKLPAKSK